MDIKRISQTRTDGPGAAAFERFMMALSEAEGLTDPDELGLRRMAQQIEDIKQVFREKALGQGGDVQADTDQKRISCVDCELFDQDKRHCKLESNLVGDALIARVMAEGCNIYSPLDKTAERKRPLGAIRQASVRGDIDLEAEKIEKPKPTGGFTVRKASQRGQAIRRGGIL